ncbi:uncharacterized protein [Montipora foliosa]|uniref:uncharacterized protein n=1 Tax=Montipora foliosa TaxID=591990 RepID=UPI0035F1B54A
MEQLVAIVAVCRLAIFKRMPAPPLTLMMAHRLYNSDKLSSLRVDKLSLYFSHHKITFKWKKTEEIAMIKAHIGSLLYDSMERQQPRQPPLRNVRQQVTSSLPEVETNLQSDVVDRIVGAGPSSSSDESSPVTDFIPEPRVETSNYGRKRARVEREGSWSGKTPASKPTKKRRSLQAHLDKRLVMGSRLIRRKETSQDDNEEELRPTRQKDEVRGKHEQRNNDTPARSCQRS